MPRGPVTLPQVQMALQELGGEASFYEILSKVTENRENDYAYYRNRENYEKTCFQVVQQHCPCYKKFKGHEVFAKTGNRFRLLSIASEAIHPIQPSLPPPELTPIAKDFKEPERVRQETYRILRDTNLAREIKRDRRYRCHICGQTLQLSNGQPYAEAHHVRPLGSPHNGPDVRENILCVCPNHHVLLDYGAMRLDESALTDISKAFIQYHNQQIFQAEET